MAEALQTLHYLDIDFTPLGLDETAQKIAERSFGSPFAYVVTPNAQHIVRINQGDQNFKVGYEHAWLRTCDSRVLNLLNKLVGGPQLPVTTGSDLTVLLFKSVIQPDDPITVIGGNPEMTERLREIYGLKNLVCHYPPMGLLKSPDNMQACVDFVVAHPSRYVFLAVGGPQSEVLASKIQETGMATGTGLCIGASLMFLTGQVQRAPVWMRRYSLEWLHRLLLNPRKHFRRVFIESMPLVWLVVSDRLKRGKR